MSRGTSSDAGLAPYRDARVAVLGATGTIGRWVVARLAAEGARLALIVRDEPTARRLLDRTGGIGDVWRVDARDGRIVTAALRDIQPDIVFNLAGHGADPAERDAAADTARAMNTDLVAALFQALPRNRRAGWHGNAVVHAGSILEEADGPGVRRDSATGRYRDTKRAGTRLALAQAETRGTAAVVARLCQVYGPGEAAGRLLPTLLDARRTTGAVSLSTGAQRRDFTYVEDVAEALVRLGLAPRPHGAIVEVGTGRLTSVRRFVEIAADLFGIARDRLAFGAVSAVNAFTNPAVSRQPMLRATGWAPATTVRAGLQRTLAQEDGGGGWPAARS